MDILAADESLLLSKLESSYGQDSSPTELADAMLVKQLQIRSLEGNRINRELDKPQGGADPNLLTNHHVAVSFGYELAASGTSGAGITAPAWSPIIQACGMDETIDNSVGTEHVAYTPSVLTDQSALSAVSLYAMKSGVNYKALGARGGWSMSLANGIPMINVDMRGLYVAPADIVLPTADYSAWQDPLPVDVDNTPTIDFFGYAVALFGLEITSGISPVAINTPGYQGVHLTSREITGKITIAKQKLASKDYYALAKAGTTGALAFQHGVAAGSICMVDADAVQIDNITEGERDKIATLEMDVRFTTQGSTEFKLTTK